MLLVSAQPPQTMMLSRALEQGGYNVLSCASGREAVLCLMETQTDLVLINDPLSDGSTLALLQWLRARADTSQLVCFVIAKDGAAELYDAGADLVITRPAEVDLLTRKVAAALVRRAPSFVS